MISLSQHSDSKVVSTDLCTLIHGDCLSVIPNLKEVDAVIADMPFGTTQCRWDQVINLDRLWSALNLVTGERAPFILHAQPPFNIVLGGSNLPMYKYDWIWEKTTATGHMNSKKMPMKAHENIMVFYDKLPTYNPQMTEGHKPVNSYTKHTDDGELYGDTKPGRSGGGSTSRYPRSVLKHSTDKQRSNLHPTQKPIALVEYMVQTYTNPGDTVLDFCMGSGTTGVACKNLGRRFIGIEIDKQYFDIACERIKSS